jgi:uncharacterized protein (TIGR02145 family)
MVKIFSLLVLFIYSAALNSQSITNVKAEMDDNTIIITYNLKADTTSFISVSVSEDNGDSWIGPLKNVTGDVGNGIHSGNRRIVWNVTQDKDIFSGDNILFRVVGICAGSVSNDSFIDIRDAITYRMVKIGKQTWMGENLNFNIPEGSWCYDNKKDNCTIYGRLYNWESAKVACPVDWHLPSDSEWKQLIDYYGGESIAGVRLKSKKGWELDDNSVSNKNVFLAFPGGYYTNTKFMDIVRAGTFWTSSEIDGSLGYYFLMKSVQSYCRRLSLLKNTGMSVRCIKN